MSDHLVVVLVLLIVLVPSALVVGVVVLNELRRDHGRYPRGFRWLDGRLTGSSRSLRSLALRIFYPEDLPKEKS